MKISLSLVVLICLLSVASNDFGLQRNRSVLSVANATELPAQVIHASIDSMIVSSSVQIEVYNTLPETIQELRFRILKYSNSKVIETADGVVIDPVPPGNHRYRTPVDITLDRGTQATLVVTKVRTNSGVWFTEPDGLNKVIYEPNISLTRDEKTEILGTVLNQLARDPNQARFIGNNRRLLVSREDCNDALHLPDTSSIEVLHLDAIQAIADRDQRAVYVRCGAFAVEGSRVNLHLTLNDRLARRGKQMRVPFRYNFQFVLLKKDGKWFIEKSDGYT